MTALHRIPPGRGGALWLRHRLDLAGRGIALLQQKAVILQQEAHRLRLLDRTTHADWAKRDTDARVWVGRGVLLTGELELNRAVGIGATEVVLVWRTVMGVTYPVDATVHTPQNPLTQPTAGSAALVRAQTAYRTAAEAAIRHAVASAALRTLEAEIATTRQRIRALERHWVPRLRETLAVTESQLAEMESADSARRRRAAARNSARDR